MSNSVRHRTLLRTLSLLAGAAIVPVARAQRPVPTPESSFGFAVGADYKLFDYEQSIAYFRRLAAASNRIKLLEVGQTSFGRPMMVAIVSSPENLARLDDIRRVNMRIAHPEGLTDSLAHRLAAQGKVIVDISGGLHASEIAGSQHTPLLAYRLLSNPNDPTTKAILDNVVLFLWPSINPDGQDIVVNWCRARDDQKNPGAMELYQKYIGHDNNRDAYMLNVIESRVIQRTWRDWEPDIVYVHHQSSPFPTRIWIPPFADPVGLRVPPIVAREVNAIGTRIAEELDANGQPGAAHQLATFDAWYPGYIDYMPMYQNIASWWTETQGGNCATPRTTTLDSLPADYRDLRPTTMYLSPWTEGKWSLRDAVDYMVTASFATLNYAAKFREEILYNRYQAGRNTIQQFRNNPPYAYFIRQAQRDPVAPVELLQRLAFMGVRVKQLGRDMTYDGISYPKGTWVIPMDQEYAQLVRELLEAQKYPEIKDDTPYDAAGWTLPYQMGVDVIEGRVALTPELRAALVPIEGKAVDWHTRSDAPFTTNAVAAGISPLAGAITGTGSEIELVPAQNNVFRFMNRALGAGATLRYAPATPTRSGRWLVGGIDSAKAVASAADLFIQATRSSNDAVPNAIPARLRLALYKAGPGNMDEGWTEWLLDTNDYHYTVITPSDLHSGNLGARFDVILVASQGLMSPRGGRGGGGASPDTAALRVEDSVRVHAFDEFVRGGGTLVAWNQGAAAAVNALQLPVKNVVAGLPRREYFTGGSIMRVVVDTSHPIMAGMPANADVFVFNSPVFTTLDGFDGAVLAKYPNESILRSGYLSGEKHMQGMAAALDVKRDRGHVVLFAFQPQWRGQSTGTFRVVFNATLFGGGVSSQARGTPGFWTAPTLGTDR
ncbi:MAG TPA: M14 metallopeptidase family protein [Gemmatimonadaceae bacterium]|nr:M14 metallopeptidase family protein [Gemmatimonadaceae bacterium]